MDAYAKSKTPSDARDRRGTPPGLSDLICQRLNIQFVMDVCAEPYTKQAPLYWDEADNALIKPWATYYKLLPGKRGVAGFWMNPPYSDPAAWIKKAIEEAKKGCITVALLPDDRSTKWYQLVKEHASAVLVTDKRIPFLDKDGIPQFGNPKGSLIPVFAPWSLGWVEQTLEIPSELMQHWRAIRRELCQK